MTQASLLVTLGLCWGRNLCSRNLCLRQNKTKKDKRNRAKRTGTSQTSQTSQAFGQIKCLDLRHQCRTRGESSIRSRHKKPPQAPKQRRSRGSALQGDRKGPVSSKPRKSKGVETSTGTKTRDKEHCKRPAQAVAARPKTVLRSSAKAALADGQALAQEGRRGKGREERGESDDRQKTTKDDIWTKVATGPLGLWAHTTHHSPLTTHDPTSGRRGLDSHLGSMMGHSEGHSEGHSVPAGGGSQQRLAARGSAASGPLVPLCLYL